MCSASHLNLGVGFSHKIQMCVCVSIYIYNINSLSPVCLSVKGVLGGGEGKVGEATGDHHSFHTSQVYKPGPDLHKASQPSERKE
jgi:tetrahydromethanopterin S-methyltransferase subunit E